MKEDGPGPLDKISKFLRKDNNLSLTIAGVAAVALIVFILTSMSGSGQNPSDAQAAGGNAPAADSSSESLETRLERILSQVEGTGQVKVLVTYETGPEIVPAVKTDTQSNTSENSGQDSRTTSITENSEPVVVQGKNGTEPMVLTQKEPVVLGVLVVAEGASSLSVRLRLMQAVQVALQIAPDRIEVLPMNITENREGN
jgi:stage III sporulation protein AG